MHGLVQVWNTHLWSQLPHGDEEQGGRYTKYMLNINNIVDQNIGTGRHNFGNRHHYNYCKTPNQILL